MEVFTERGVGTMVLPDDLSTGAVPVVRAGGGS
jgi:acetylglutamate kinase